MWDLIPWPGIEPGPLHWELAVLTTAPPGKSPTFILNQPLEVSIVLLHKFGSMIFSFFMEYLIHIKEYMRMYDVDINAYVNYNNKKL